VTASELRQLQWKLLTITSGMKMLWLYEMSQGGRINSRVASQNFARSHSMCIEVAEVVSNLSTGHEIGETILRAFLEPAVIIKSLNQSYVSMVAMKMHRNY
jgi:hypothetical protein